MNNTVFLKETVSCLTDEFTPRANSICQGCREGSFTGAAKRLELAKSSVSKKIAALEDRNAVRLIQRTTRQLHITEEGLALYQHYL